MANLHDNSKTNMATIVNKAFEASIKRPFQKLVLCVLQRGLLTLENNKSHPPNCLGPSSIFSWLETPVKHSHSVLKYYFTHFGTLVSLKMAHSPLLYYPSFSTRTRNFILVNNSFSLVFSKTLRAFFGVQERTKRKKS